MSVIWKDAKKGVTFWVNGKEIHSYKNYGLYLQRVEIGAPEPYTHTVQVPGRDGVVDLTEYMYKTVKYKNRKITISLFLPDAHKNWTSVYSRIASELHGKNVYVTLDEDPEYDYYGRITINKFASARHKGVFTLVVDARPYKHYGVDIYDYVTVDGLEMNAWKWDDFSFVSGVIYRTVWTNPNGNIKIVCGRATSVAFKATANATLKYNGKTVTIIGDGSVQNGFELAEGENTINAVCSGTLYADYSIEVL